MARTLTVLKLGGSVITNKGRIFSASTRRISRLMTEICSSIAGALIIVHGGGSFGHFLAKRYKLQEGYVDRSQVTGFVRTRQSMTELNRIVLDLAIESGLPCVTMQPSAFVTMRNKTIRTMDLKGIIRLLRLRMIPLLFGDVAFDEKLGFCILSGDQLVSWLAIKLHAKQVVFVVDVDGVFDSDPKRSRAAKLLRKVSVKDVRTLIQRGERETRGVDVTGGMMGKLREILPAVEKGARAVILNGCVPGRLSECLKGKLTVGTVIEP